MAAISLFKLFWIFAYVGLLTIGGGLVAIPIMQQEIIGRGLIDAKDFFNMVAISESTPGPIGINMATYIGYVLHGIPGGIMTSIGTTLPSLVIILAIAMYFGKIQDKPLVRAAFKGLRPATTGMILVAAANVFILALLNFDAFKLSGSIANLFNVKNIIFYAIGTALLFKKVHPIIVLAMGAVFGVMLL